MVYLAASNDAQVAQLVEHATENRSVTSSILVLGTISLSFLQRGYRVVAFDRRGHGRSSQVSNGHDMDHYATDAAPVVEHLRQPMCVAPLDQSRVTVANAINAAHPF